MTLRILLFFALSFLPGFTMETLNFPSKDGLEITADFYPHSQKDAPFVLLCHQAGWSRGEYRETAKWFNAQGVHAFAIDQRSGGAVNGVKNETAQRAQAQGLATNYLAAQQDIEAAIEYVRKTYQPTALILVGSSYSATLALRISAENKYPLTATLAFSPGEYIETNRNFLSEMVAQIKTPVFITSARDEDERWKAFSANIPKGKLNTFLPSLKGRHGSSALWRSTEGHMLYRRATYAFLNNL